MADNVTVDNGGLTDYTVATKDLGSGIHAQVLAPYQQNRSDDHTGAGNGTTVDVSLVPCRLFSLQLAGVGGSPSAWEMVLEASMDNTNFDPLLVHATANGDALGDLKLFAVAAPVKYFRSRCVSVTLNGATSLRAYILGAAS